MRCRTGVPVLLHMATAGLLSRQHFVSFPARARACDELAGAEKWWPTYLACLSSCAAGQLGMCMARRDVLRLGSWDDERHCCMPRPSATSCHPHQHTSQKPLPPGRRRHHRPFENYNQGCLIPNLRNRSRPNMALCWHAQQRPSLQPQHQRSPSTCKRGAKGDITDGRLSAANPHLQNPHARQAGGTIILQRPHCALRHRGVASFSTEHDKVERMPKVSLIWQRPTALTDSELAPRACQLRHGHGAARGSTPITATIALARKRCECAVVRAC